MAFSQKLKIYILFVVLSIIEIGISVGIYFFMLNNDNISIENRIIDTNNHIISNIDFLFNTHIYNLDKAAAIFYAYPNNYISKNAYENILQFYNSPVVNSTETMSWIRKVTNTTFDKFENFAKKNVEDGFYIKQISNTNNFVPALRNKNYYWPIVFRDSYFNVTGITGFNITSIKNSDIIGLDMSFAPSTNVYVNQALSSNNFAISSRVNSTHVINPSIVGYNIIITKLSTENYNPSSANISQVIGFITLNIRIDALLTIAFENVIDYNKQNIDIFMFDMSNNISNSSLLYKSVKYPNVWSLSDLNFNEFAIKKYDYNIINKNWVIVLKYSDYYINNNRSSVVLIMPIVVVVIFILANILIYSQIYFFIIMKIKRDAATQMLGYVNHEIRNPLNVIKGLIEYLYDRMTTHIKENVQNFGKNEMEIAISDLSTALGACGLLEHIVSDILDIRKLEERKIKLDNKNIDLDIFIRDIKKTYSQKIDEKQHVKMEIICRTIDTIYIDIYRLKQILINYITNAIKYTEYGTITLLIEEKNKKLRFSVADTGRGIKDVAKSKIFQPFNQVNPDDASRYGGIGLGLYLCKMLAECMHGCVGFESEFGKGSTFWVEFPLNIVKMIN